MVRRRQSRFFKRLALPSEPSLVVFCSDFFSFHNTFNKEEFGKPRTVNLFLFCKGQVAAAEERREALPGQ